MLRELRKTRNKSVSRTIATKKKKNESQRCCPPLPRTRRSRWSRCSLCLSNTSPPDPPSLNLCCASLMERQVSPCFRFHSTAPGLVKENSASFLFVLFVTHRYGVKTGPGIPALLQTPPGADRLSAEETPAYG